MLGMIKIKALHALAIFKCVLTYIDFILSIMKSCNAGACKSISSNACQGFRETPIGEGGVDFPRYIAALRDIGYVGFLTIERECGEDPLSDIRAAVEYIKPLL